MAREKIWTDEAVEIELINLMKKLNIQYLPTYKEVRTHIGKNGITTAMLSKGILFWSEMLGVPTKLEYLGCQARGKNKTHEQKTEQMEPEPVKAKGFEVYKDEERLAYDKAKDEAYIKQCQPSEITEYTLSPEELAKYQKIPKPDPKIDNPSFIKFFYAKGEQSANQKRI